MFTGIVEEVGVVKRINRGSGSSRLTIEAHTACKDMKVGDSIAVNGVCLTVVKLGHNTISFDITAETLKNTNLGKIKLAERVNLERSLKAGDRISGHFVSGHIDGMGRLVMKQTVKENLILKIEAPSHIMEYLVPRGSVAVDGISLTITDLQKDVFLVYIIPHTLKVTNLGFKNPQDILNLEVDLLGKFVYRYLSKKETEGPKLTKGFLAEHGFII